MRGIPLFLVCACLFSSLAYAGVSFPRVSGGTKYAGELVVKHATEQAELTLLDEHYFILRQTFSSGTRRFVRDMTGFWRQRDGGALLTLENRHGLFLKLNVGAKDTLYGILPDVHERSRPFFTLQAVPFAFPTFTLMGTLERTGSGAQFTDSATGKIFRLEGDALTPLPKGESFFADVELSLGEKSSRLVRIRSLSRNFPSRAEKPQDVPFARLVSGRTWWITFPSGLTVSCVFEEVREGEGRLEISGQGLWLSVPYAVAEKALSFTLSRKDARMLTVCEAKELLALLSATKGWMRDGSAIILMGAEGELALLEDASQRSVQTGRFGIRR